MFKFVNPSPRTNSGHIQRKCGDEARSKERGSSSLLYHLYKHSDKASILHKRKRKLDKTCGNHDGDLKQIQTTKQECIESAAKTNTGLFGRKNVVTLEENEGGRIQPLLINSKKLTRLTKAGPKSHSPGKNKVQSEIACTVSDTSCDGGYHFELPRDHTAQSAKNCKSIKSAGCETTLAPLKVRSEMTHDRSSVSDSDGDSGSWLDQPSPILLTASPPQSALKVPAARLVESPFSDSWNHHSYGYSDEQVDENSNYLESANGLPSIRSIQQEASELFCSSLRDNARFAKTVVNKSANGQRRVLQPQHPESEVQVCQNSFKINRLSGAQIPTSGQLFVNGPLFLTSDGCDEDYHENVPREAIIKDAPGTNQRITDPLYPVSNYNGPLCHSNGGMTFHNHSGSKILAKTETMKGNSRYCLPSSKVGSTYQGVIGVDDALFNNGKFDHNHRVEQSSARKPTNFIQHRAEHNRATDKNEVGANKSDTKIRSKRLMSAKSRNRKQVTSDDDEDDDDATTLTMVTNSDVGEELSSSSSDTTSTAIESVGTSPRPNQEHHDSSFIIERVDLHSIASSEGDIFNQNDYPGHRRASFRRSFSRQSGKLRDRLNAVTDDQGSEFESTAEENNTEFYSGSEIDMPSYSPHSSAEISPSSASHTRVKQLKRECTLGKGRTSRSLTRLSARKESPTRSKRCRSLDRGLRSSFISALSPSHSDISGRRSLINLRQSSSLGSDSDLSLHSPLGRRQRLTRTRSTSSLVDQYKPKIDVAESLSALILNPIIASAHDRKTLTEYLKRSSWNSLKDGEYTKHDYSPSPWLRRNCKSGSEPSTGGLTPSNFETEDRANSRTSNSSRPRESKIISKSHTSNRYAAVGSSPRSIASLLPSPRRDSKNESEVIEIIDNDVPGVEFTEHEQVGRRNSFIEAVTGNSSQSAHSNNSDDEEGVVRAFNSLAKTAEKVLTPRNSTVISSDHPLQVTDKIKSKEPMEIRPDEVDVNITTDPISNDLRVAVIRRPSTRSHSTSSEPPSPMVKRNPVRQNSSVFHPSLSQLNQPTLACGSVENMQGIDHLQIQQLDIHKDQVVTVKCRNSRCRKEMCLEDGKAKYKSCHHCYTYYCSQQCRLAHWERHKTKCIFARVNSDCKKILRMGREDDVVRQAFTRVARTGYLSRGRGCVQVIFSCPEKAENFITEGLFALESLPLYRTVQELLELKGRLVENSDLITDALIQTCEIEYDGEATYVLQVLIDIPEETLRMFNRPYRHQNSHGVYLHTVNPVFKYEADGKYTTPVKNAPDTLILTPPTTVPETWITTPLRGSTYSTPSPAFSHTSSLMSESFPGEDTTRHAKRARQLCFINIQRKLREKGVTLRHQYPDVYCKLCAYVDTGAHFTPVVIYPQDTRTGKNFMCLVMPGSEPQILGWVKTPGLLDDIATG